MLKETKDSYEGMLESAVTWFGDIAEWCDMLKDGKVSQNEAIMNIKGKAVRASEYIKKKLKGGQ